MEEDQLTPYRQAGDTVRVLVESLSDSIDRKLLPRESRRCKNFIAIGFPVTDVKSLPLKNQHPCGLPVCEW
jgi:hypothetical protein